MKYKIRNPLTKQDEIHTCYTKAVNRATDNGRLIGHRIIILR